MALNFQSNIYGCSSIHHNGPNESTWCAWIAWTIMVRKKMERRVPPLVTKEEQAFLTNPLVPFTNHPTDAILQAKAPIAHLYCCNESPMSSLCCCVLCTDWVESWGISQPNWSPIHLNIRVSVSRGCELLRWADGLRPQPGRGLWPLPGWSLLYNTQYSTLHYIQYRL